MPLPLARLLRLSVVALVALGVALAPATPAGAHADLITSDPADGSLVPEAPPEIRLQFTEEVSLQADGVRVLDGEGDRVDGSVATAEGATVVAPLEDLADGTYVVAWRVVSADGHPVRGSFTFSVGVQTGVDASLAQGAFGSGDDTRYEVAAAILRVLAYVAALGAAGAVLIGAELRREDDPSPVKRWVGVAAATGLAALVASIPVRAALVSGQGLGSVTDRSVLSLAVGDGVVVSVLVTVFGLLALLVTTNLPFTTPVRTIALTGAFVAPAGFALAGHTRTMSPVILAGVVDAAHLWAGAVWFGGLVAVLGAVRRRRRAGDPLGAAEAIARYSGIAAVAAGVVAAAGLVMAWMEVGGLDPLRTTTYGRLLLAKVAVVLAVVAMAAWNRFRLVGRVAAAAIEEPPVDDDGSWRTLLGLVRLEVVGLVVVLGLTGVLVNVTPADDAYRPGQVSVSTSLADGTMDVTLDPAQPGRNDVHLYLFDAQGALDDRYTDPSVRLSLPSQGVGPFDREPVAAGPGHYLLVGTDLPLAGTWELTLTVKADRFSEEQATVTLPVR